MSRTTFRLDEDLLAEAKAFAARQHRSLNSVMEDALRRMLERASFTVMTAPHGREALRLFREHPVDLAITDLLMPEMDGFELIRELTAQWPSIRIIAISGADIRLDMARQLGAKAVLKKPVTGAALVSAVEQVLAAVS